MGACLMLRLYIVYTILLMHNDLAVVLLCRQTNLTSNNIQNLIKILSIQNT
jgi:hypothetical protein